MGTISNQTIEEELALFNSDLQIHPWVILKEVHYELASAVLGDEDITWNHSIPLDIPFLRMADLGLG